MGILQLNSLHNVSHMIIILFSLQIKLDSNFTSVMLAVMVIEGLARSLDPEMDMLEAAKPFLLISAKKQIMMTFDVD